MKKGFVPKIFLIVIIAVVVILGGGIIALYLLFPPQKVVALIIPQAEKATGRTITIADAAFRFFPSLGLSLSGLQVSNTGREGFSKEPFVTVEKFTASVSLMSIFRGSPEITSIMLRKPSLLIEVNEKGAFNFDDMAQPSGQKVPHGMPPLPVPITLEKLVIEEGSLVYDDHKAGMRTFIGSMDEEVKISIDKALKNVATSGEGKISRLSLKMKGMDLPLSKLAVSFSHDLAADLETGVVTVHLVKATAGKITVGVKGNVTEALTPRPQLDLQLVADPIALSDVLALASLGLPASAPKVSASGLMELGCAFKGPLIPNAPLPVVGSLKVKNAEVKYADLPESVSGLNADFAFTGNSLSINALTARIGKSPIEVRAVITDFAKPFVDAAVKADIDLDEAKQAVKLPKGASVGGRATADIRVVGFADPADPGKLLCTGGVTLRGVTVLWPPLTTAAVMNGTVTLSKEALAENIAIAVGQSSFITNATVTHYLSLIAPPGAKIAHRAAVECKVSSAFLDIDKVMNLAPPGKPGAKSGAAAPPDMLLPAPLPMADLHGVFIATKINYKGFTMGNVSAKIASIGSRADVDFSSTFSTGTIASTLQADLTNPKAISFADKFIVKNVELNDLMARFGDFIKPVTPLNRELLQINKGLFGRINVDGVMQGRGSTPEQIMKSISGTMNIHMANGKLENTPFQTAAAGAFAAFLKTDQLGSINPINFKELGAATRIAGSRVTIDELKILSDLGDWNAKGTVGFDAVMDMAVSTRLSKEISGRILAVEGTVKGLAANALKGTQFAAATGLLDNVSIIPHDNEGRVWLKFGLAGIVNTPKLTSLSFGQVGSQSTTSSAQPTVKQQAGKQVESVKQGAQEQLQKAGEEIKNKLKGLFK